MAENNSLPPLMTDKELLMEGSAYSEIMAAAFEYADSYCSSGDEPRRYAVAIDHLRKTVRAEITKFSRANYKTNAATEFDAQAVAAQAPSLRGSLMMPAEPTPTPSTALASLRHLYQQLISGTVKDASDAKRIATGLLGPAIEKLEAGPAAPAAVADDAPLAVRTAPKKIWLDLGDDEAGDCDFSDLEEVTWSSNNASGCGIEYVRAALAATQAQDTPKATAKED